MTHVPAIGGHVVSLQRYAANDGETRENRRDLATWLEETPYRAYAYSYPHKTCYRSLRESQALDALWSTEDRSALFLYVHVPFCERRCGYCNLFARSDVRQDLPELYVAAVERQAGVVREALGNATIARFAVGGGTPTELSPSWLARILEIPQKTFGSPPHAIPTSVETSPNSVTKEHVALLGSLEVERISIGVQSFVENEVRAVGRHQENRSVQAALDRLCAVRFPCLNIDLIYGLPGQTVASWLDTLRCALRWQPEELYLYPLYVRPNTPVAERLIPWLDLRIECYRRGRELLLAEGYAQHSMRRFRRQDAQVAASPAYSCQEDGMIGLGCGARSYTRSLHYSEEWAVGTRAVQDILASFVARKDSNFRVARFGYELDAEDRRRRYVIKSLLQQEGLNLSRYRVFFDTDAMTDLPELHELVKLGLAEHSAPFLRLKPRGLERSDCIAPWLFSARATRQSREYDLR